MTREDIGVDGRVWFGNAGRDEPRLGLAETIVKSAGRHAFRRAVGSWDEAFVLGPSDVAYIASSGSADSFSFSA